MCYVLRSLLTLGFVSLLAGSSRAQSGPPATGFLTYSGRVISSTLQPLSGATVWVKGTTVVITTNSEGAFLLNAPAGPQTLLAEYPGYLAVQLPILRPDSTLTIKLFSTQPGKKKKRRKGGL